MVALSLRGLASRKLRTALTSLAIVLGVGLVSGTYILTDTMNRAFDAVFEAVHRKTDVIVTPREQFDHAGMTPFPAATLERVKAVPGVALAGGLAESPTAVIYKKNGRDPLITGGAPMLLSGAAVRAFDPLTYVEGRPPEAPDEVALDRRSVERGGYRLGDTVMVSGDGPREPLRLVGITELDGSASFAGAAVAVVQLATAQRMLHLRGELTSIVVRAEEGVSAAELAGRIRAALPADRFAVRTGEQEARKQATDLQDQLSFLNTFLLAFAGIALFVGAFLIVNTYSITVAQRMREFALLRMIGASRRQVLRAVLGEALVVGFVASLLGFLLGFGLAPALRGLFSAFGADLPSQGLVLEARTVIVSLLVGTLVTVVAALGPALRATRVPPIMALQDVARLTRGRTGRLRTPLSLAVVLVGVALMCVGLFGNGSAADAAGAVGLGGAVVFIGVGLLAAHLVRPLALAVGLPLERLRGISGRLARENAMRQPRRTAATSAALMVGVALVAFVAIFAAGLKASIDAAVDRGVRADLIAQTETFLPIPASARAELARVPGVEAVTSVRFASAKVPGVAGTASVSGIDPATANDAVELAWREGSPDRLGALRPGEALLAKGFADEHGVRVGDRVRVLTPTGARVAATVTGIYDNEAGLFGEMVMPNEVLARAFNVTSDAVLLATTAAGADLDAVRARADRALAPRYPTVEVLTKEGFKDDQARQVDQLVSLVYVLLSLSVIVSLLGIVNTLVLAIHERTRELGMLRAIGTSRRQVRQIVRYEAVITALIGAVLGVVLGAVFAVLVTIPLRDEGFTTSVPVGTLLVLLVLAAIAGVLAAIAPARRAAKLDVLRALAYE